MKIKYFFTCYFETVYLNNNTNLKKCLYYCLNTKKCKLKKIDN